MTIKILAFGEKKTLHFDSVEDLNNFNQMIKDALIDEKNIAIATYAKDKVYYVFPAQLLKNSIIEINYDESTTELFFF